ncbi:MAG: ABC transporter permease [Bryobacteraceae bacterium]
MKRTIALKMVVLAPVAVVLLTLFMASQAPFSTLRMHRAAADPWRALSRVNLQFWGLLMLPMYVTLQTALIAGIDHDNQWKALFARPVPRWTTYVAKLAVVITMAVASAAILVAGVLAEGGFLNWFDAELGFGAAVPVALIARQAAQMTGLAFLSLTIQHWVSSSMAVFFRGDRFRDCGPRDQLCHAVGGRTVRRMTAVFSVVVTDAGGRPGCPECFDDVVDPRHSGHRHKRCRVYRFLQARGQLRKRASIQRSSAPRNNTQKLSFGAKLGHWRPAARRPRSTTRVRHDQALRPLPLIAAP